VIDERIILEWILDSLGVLDCIHLSLGRRWMRALVNTVMELRIY
jgi:hypothetical protein